MGLYGDMKEEAFSEGLVAITEAAKTYDPSKGIPVAHWLAKNIRWSLATWITKQRATLSVEASLPWQKINWEATSPTTLRDTLEAVKEGSQDALSARTELASLLRRMQVLLTQDERLILLYSAAGYKGIEIAKMSGLSPVQVSILKTGAQRKLRESE
jgi:RNA polymerase sigma factor (sigma-70 family)